MDPILQLVLETIQKLNNEITVDIGLMFLGTFTLSALSIYFFSMSLNAGHATYRQLSLILAGTIPWLIARFELMIHSAGYYLRLVEQTIFNEVGDARLTALRQLGGWEAWRAVHFHSNLLGLTDIASMAGVLLVVILIACDAWDRKLGTSTKYRRELSRQAWIMRFGWTFLIIGIIAAVLAPRYATY